MSTEKSNMHILITGGAGFIGSNLALHLSQSIPDARVVCMDNLYRRGSELNVNRLRKAGVQFHWGDIRDPGSFPAERFELVIECSAEPSVLAGQTGTPDYLFHTNLSGAFNCLEKARTWNAGLIFLSTSRVYPIAKLESHPWHEEKTRFAWSDIGTAGITSQGVTEDLDLSGPRSLYGFTKLAAEQLIDEYRASYGLKAVVNRCGVVAGPWQFGKVDQGVAALWVLAHHFERPLQYIGYGGQGKQVRDLLHIDDLCDLISEQIRDFDRWHGWCGNVSGGWTNSVSLLELTDLCSEITGKTISIKNVTENRPNDLRIFIGDCARLFERTQWHPKRTVKQTLKDLADWVDENSNVLKELW